MFLCKTAGQFFKALSVQTHTSLGQWLSDGPILYFPIVRSWPFGKKNNALFLKAYKQTVYLFGVRPWQYNTLKGSKKVRSSQHLGKKWRTKQFFLGFFTTNCWRNFWRKIILNHKSPTSIIHTHPSNYVWNHSGSGIKANVKCSRCKNSSRR